LGAVPVIVDRDINPDDTVIGTWSLFTSIIVSSIIFGYAMVVL
jgi:hypothetical protein